MNKPFVVIIFALYMCGLSASHPLFMNGYSLGSQTNLGSNSITLDDIAEAMIVMPEEKQLKIYQALVELNENLTPRSKTQRFILSIPTAVQQKDNEIQSLKQILSNNLPTSLLFPTLPAPASHQPSLLSALSSGPSFHSHTHGDHHHLHKPIKTHGIDLIISTQTHEYKPEKKSNKSENSSEKLQLNEKDNDDDFFSIFSDILDSIVKENIKLDDAPDKTKTADILDDKSAETVEKNSPEEDIKNADQVSDENKTTETKSNESSVSEQETSEATLDQPVDSTEKPYEPTLEKSSNLDEEASETTPNETLDSAESTTGSLESAEEPLQLIQQNQISDSKEKATDQISEATLDQPDSVEKPYEPTLEKSSNLDEEASETSPNQTLESAESTTGSLDSAEESLQLIQQNQISDSKEKATDQTSEDQSNELQTPVEPKQNELEELSDSSSTNLNKTLEITPDEFAETKGTESANQNHTMDSKTTDGKIVESQEPIQVDESKTAEAISPQKKGLPRERKLKRTKSKKSLNKDETQTTKKRGKNALPKTEEFGEDTKLQK